MRVVGILGSPRAGGNTECLVTAFLEEFAAFDWHVDKYFLSELMVQPCQGCESCQDGGICKVNDDDAALMLGALSRCDALIIGSPVYYRNVTAQLKALFD